MRKLILVGLVLGMLIFGAGCNLLSQEQSSTPVVSTSDTTPTLTATCVDKFNRGVSVTCAWNDYKINGGAIEKDADNQIEVNCGDKVEGLVNATNYYKQKVVVESVPCEENPQVAVELLNYDTAPDIQLKNQDDGLINDATNTEALAANNVDTQTVLIYSSYQDGIQDATFYLDLRGTNVDKVTSSAGIDIGKPKSMTHNNTINRTGAAANTAKGDSQSADELYAFELGDIGDQAIEQFTVTIDVGATAYGTDNGTIGIMDKGWYVGHDGNFKKDYQDDDNSDLEQAHHDFDEAVFTAST